MIFLFFSPVEDFPKIEECLHSTTCETISAEINCDNCDTVILLKWYS